MALSPGDLAPAFTLTDDAGLAVSLSDYAGRRVLLFAYPAAMTPGCTKEACAFRDALPEMAITGLIITPIFRSVIRFKPAPMA